MEDRIKSTPNEYLPLRDVVFKTLRENILKGILKPKQRLMELQLAEELGVSRTPIREAMRMLELEGLVVMIPRRGAIVAEITKKDLEDVLEVRCALEELAVALACAKITKQQIEELKQTVLEFQHAMEDNDITSLAEKDVAFHDIIFAATNNPRLIQLLNNLREQMYRYRVEYLKDKKTHIILVKEHETIIQNLEQRDVENAKKNISRHITNQVYNVSRYIDLSAEKSNNNFDTIS